MKVYIVNLLSATERKKHMENVIGQYNFIEPIFVEAVDGRIMTEEERNAAFDYEKSYKEYGRVLRNGEVGCTLSHYKIYKQMIKSEDKSVIVFEDDLEDLSEMNKDFLASIKPYYETNIPTVILLSGNYQYYKLKKIDSKHKLATVFDAYFTCSYIINRKAAEIISNEKPFWLADDWGYFKSKGVRIFGIKPHIIDPLPTSETMPSQIYADGLSNTFIRKNMPILKAIKSYCRFGIIKMLKFIGLHEPISHQEKGNK